MLKADYYEIFDATHELLARLRRFASGDMTHEALGAWARAAWRPEHGQAGPLAGNPRATALLLDAFNAEDRHDPRDADSPRIFRPRDATEALRWFHAAPLEGEPAVIGHFWLDFDRVARQVERPTRRSVVDGIGWHEDLRFASPGTGRRFSLARCLPQRGPRVTASTESGGDPADVLADFAETTGCDDAELEHRAAPFDVPLPRWALHRQDDNGNEFVVSTHASRVRACSERDRFAARMHKQLYWVSRG